MNAIIWHKFDLNSPFNITKVYNYIKKNFKHIDCLVNCAMHSNRGKNYLYNHKNYTKEMNGVFGSTFLLTEKLLPLIRKSKKGKIINVGSVWGSHAPRFDVFLDMDIGPTPIIASGKAALMQYTKFLASRENTYNIKSNCLIPGWFPRKGKVERKDYIRKIVQNIPEKRIEGTASRGQEERLPSSQNQSSSNQRQLSRRQRRAQARKMKRG